MCLHGHFLLSHRYRVSFAGNPALLGLPSAVARDGLQWVYDLFNGHVACCTPPSMLTNGQDVQSPPGTRGHRALRRRLKQSVDAVPYGDNHPDDVHVLHRGHGFPKPRGGLPRPARMVDLLSLSPTADIVQAWALGARNLVAPGSIRDHTAVDPTGGLPMEGAGRNDLDNAPE